MDGNIDACEVGLDGDDDDMSDQLSGTLSFSDQSPSSSDMAASMSQQHTNTLNTTGIDSSETSNTRSLEGSPQYKPHGPDTQNHVQGLFTQCKVIFKITSAKTVKSGKDKYVAYSLVVRITPGVDQSPALIDRRFTDFYQLNEKLKQKFPLEMQRTTFPKKTVIGNFKPSTIGLRSLSFENYLQYIHSVRSIRQSEEFMDFLTLPELKVASEMIRCEQFESATPVLLNIVHMLQKVTCAERLVYVLCSLLTCYDKCEDMDRACQYADLALDQVTPSSPLYVPLLQQAVHLYWGKGRDKHHLEALLERAIMSSERHTDTGAPLEVTTNLLETISTMYL